MKNTADRSVRKLALRVLAFTMAVAPLFSPSLRAQEGETEPRVSVHNRTLSQSLLEQSYHEDDVRAIGTLVEALRLDPTNEPAAYRTGYLYHKMNRIKEAIQYYGMTLSINPCHEKALNNLASLLYKTGRKGEALELYLKSSSCKPDFYLPYYNAGNLYREQKRYDEAVSSYEKAIERNSSHFPSHHNLAVSYLALSRKPRLLPREREEFLDNAEKHARKAADLSPRQPLLHVTLGEILEERKKWSQAREEYSEAARLYFDDRNQKNRMERKVREMEAKMGKGEE